MSSPLKGAIVVLVYLGLFAAIVINGCRRHQSVRTLHRVILKDSYGTASYIETIKSVKDTVGWYISIDTVTDLSDTFYLIVSHSKIPVH